MSNTKQQIEEMLREYFSEVVKVAVENNNGAIAVFAERAKVVRVKYVEAIDRLVTDARIDELKHIVSNSEWSDDDFYWYEVTREEYEGTKYYSEVRHLKRDQRIAELQSQLTNKEEK